MSREEQIALLEFCRSRSILLLADEVYHRAVFNAGLAPSFLNLARDDDPVVIVNGFSKAWAMTGWRVGWVVAASAMATQWAVLSECFNTGTSPFAQQGCIAALEKSESVIDALNVKYQKGAMLVEEILATCSRIQLTPPQGAFYAFPKIDGITSSRDFCQGLLDEKDVGVAPGFTFGPGNEQYIRICFALSFARLQEGLEKLVLYANSYKEK
jgi:aspartate/methionine/tyrosine aminotransferase